eukprot:TRINITY_DN97010_c0_g1_i1.p1 TRINITY_DN97010_c0_g1~~TRINITY_DN97010_c0_g1_i1.p1  ORF type:complete len:768 (+),score=132.54 TRINITY_DN97010_c0_g1_i1:282-2306(+)
MARNNEAFQRSDRLFSVLGVLVRETCSCLSGAKEGTLTDAFLQSATLSEKEVETLGLYHELAGATRIHIVRLTLAFAVGLLLHCQLLAATYESDGELDEESMLHIVFLHSRLQSLLYKEEMELVDQCISISRENDATTGFLYRAEVGRFRIIGNSDTSLMQPTSTEESRGSSSGIVPPLPNLLMSILCEVCHQPLSQKWGYAERVLGLVQGSATDVMEQVAHLSGLISRPVSLAYYQHCRVLVVLFVIMQPIFIGIHENESSWTDSILFPLIAFWAMCGLERLAEMMENPLGNDDTDINLMEQLHDLEVSVQLSFEMAETRRWKLRQALTRAVECVPPGADFPDGPRFPPKNFEDYFCWLPIPTLVTEDMLLKHGHAEIAHSAFYQGYIYNFRGFIRKSLRRNGLGQKHKYEIIPQDIGPERMTQFEQATAGSPDHQLQSDPTVFCHYIAFRGVVSENSEELNRQAAWKMRTVNLLQGHHAAKLLCHEQGGDSARSAVLQPLAEKRPVNKKSSKLPPQMAAEEDAARRTKPPLLPPPPPSMTGSRGKADASESSSAGVRSSGRSAVAHATAPLLSCEKEASEEERTAHPGFGELKAPKKMEKESPRILADADRWVANGSHFYIGSPFVSVELAGAPSQSFTAAEELSASLAAAEARAMQSPDSSGGTHDIESPA